MANEFIIRKGYKSLAASEVTGSLTTTGNIVGEASGYLQRLYIQDKKALDSSSNFLYIDPNEEFSSGIYINNAVRIDGGLLGSYNEDLQLRTGTTTRITIANADGAVRFHNYGAGYLKTDSSGNITVDTSTIEDTLDSVTDRGATTTNSITTGDITIQDATPVLVLKDSNNGAGGSADARILFSNTGGKAIAIGTTGDDDTSTDLYISSNAGSTYGGYLLLDSAGISDAQADIIIDPKTNFKVFTAGTEALDINTSQNATFAGGVTVEGGTLDLGKADTASGHINAKELMTFNIDTDNDDTDRYFAWYKDSSSGSGTELLKILETGAATFAGDVSVEDNLYLTDAGTVRGKIQLNSSDRDNLDIKATSLGSLMRFYTVDTLALTLDASQNATFAGDITMTQSSGNNMLFINSSGGGNPVMYMQDSTRKWGQFVSNGDLFFKDETSNIESLKLDGGNGNAIFGGDVTVAGTLIAQEFHTEFVSASIIYESGSTKFGDTSDDNHDFTGSINLTGSLDVNGDARFRGTIEGDEATTLIKDVITDQTYEGTAYYNPETLNAFAGADKWATITLSNAYTSNRTTPTTSLGADPFMVGGNTSQIYFDTSETEIVIEIDHTTEPLRYHGIVGIQFTNTAWRAERVKIEGYNGSSWTTGLDTTSNAHGTVVAKLALSAAGVQKTKITLGNPANSSSGYMRISKIFGYDYKGVSSYDTTKSGTYYLEKFNDSGHYGTIFPATDSTYDLGTNTLRYANIYADTLHGSVTTATTASNAMLLDGIDSTAFLRSNVDDTMTGVLTFSKENASPSITFHNGGNDMGTNAALAEIDFTADYQGSPIAYGSIQLKTNSSSVRTDMDFVVKSTSGNQETALKLQGGAGKPKSFFYNDMSVEGNLTLAGSGVKSIQSGGDIALKTSTGEYALYGAANGNTNLYYNGVKHFQTDPDGVEVYGNIKLTGTATTTNAGRMIDFTGFDKEGTTDFSDRAYIQHTTNTGGHAGSVLVISSQNDSADGIAFLTNATSQLKHNNYTIWTSGNDGPTSGLAAQTAATASYVAASDIDGSINADTLDSINSTQFLRSDAADTASELITFQKGISQDGNAKFYTWRALDNSSNTSNLYFRIARVTSSQSSRFAIEIAGRSTSYSDTTIPAIGVIVGQLNNDNNYDIVFYNHKTATSQVVSEVGQVDVSTTATDIYIKTGQFSEISATGHISDGSITTYGGDSASATEPTNYVAATEVTVWNSGNDGPTSGLAAQTAATASYVAASDIDGSINADTLDSINSTQFLRSDESDTFTGTLTLNGQLDLSSTDTAANYIHLPRGGGITFYGDTSSHHGIFSRNNANGSADDILISSYNRIFFDLDSNNNNTNTEFSIGTHNGTTKIFNFSGETAHLTIGADDMTPMLDLLFDDHASGGGWDTRIQIGKSDDFASGVGVFPAYVPTGAYGMQIQSNSDGVFFGMEEYSTGNYRPVIQWGDDDTDSPFRIKHENGSELEITYNGDVTTSGDLTVNGGNIAVNNNNGGIQFSDVSSYWLRTATNWGIYWNTSSNQLQFHGAGSTKAFIDLDTGRIDTEEHVIANGNIYANGTGGFVFGTSTSEGEYIQRSGNDIRFVAGGSTRMTIDGDAGYVGIGTTSPGAPLTVEGSGSTLFNVQGSQGQLFSVTDDLTGDIFSVADISGIPILNINANGSSSFDGNVDIVGDTEVSGSLKVKFGNFDHNIDTSTAEEFKIHMSNDRLLHVSSSTEIKIGDIDALGDEMYFISNVNTSKLGFMSNGAEALMIDSNGFTIIPDRIVHAGDTNTYMQFHAADQWRVVTGNTERLEVNNTNTTVANTLITTAGMRLRSGASDQNGTGDSTSIPSTTVAEIMKFEGNSYTNGQYTTELVKIDRGGNLPLYFRQSKSTANSFSNLIRIGDHSNNSEIFHVFGSAKVDSELTVGNYLRTDEIRALGGQDLTITAGESSGHLTKSTHNDEIIRMAAEGGVRVFASSDNLSSGLNKQSILIDSNGNSVFGDQSALTSGGTARISSKYTSTSGVALSMGLSNSNMSYIRQNGNAVFQWQTYNGGNSGQLHFQPYGGNVGIGSSSPSAKLDVNGDLKVDNGSIGINVTPSATDGRLDAGNDVVAYSTSDRRLKENIIPISEPLNKIKKINGVEFDWIPLTDREKRVIHGNEGHDVGVIAQEIEDILPVAVKQREHSKYKAVRYEKIIPLLIEAVKDQQDIIEELTNRLDKLENK